MISCSDSRCGRMLSGSGRNSPNDCASSGWSCTLTRPACWSFGPYAAEDRKRRGEGKPESFDFLSFTHICGKKRSNERFTVLRQTIRKRLQAKLSEVKAELKRRMHDPVPEVGRWLRTVVEGHNR